MESTRTLAMTSDRTTKELPRQQLTCEPINESVSSNRSNSLDPANLKTSPYCRNTTKANSRVLSSIYA